MSTRSDLGYNDDDEAWRRAKERAGQRAGASQAAKEIGEIAKRTDPSVPHATAPSGRPVCRACGVETEILHSIAGERVTVDGVDLVGCVRTSCATCAGKASAREVDGARPAPRGSVSCR